MHQMRIIGSTFVVVSFAIHSLVSAQTAVRVTEPVGEFRTFANGEPVFGPQQNFVWEGIPSELEDQALEFWYLNPGVAGWPRISYGVTSFEVLADGPVWMITTTRFGGGGSAAGGWLDDVTYRAGLEADGWREIYSGLDDSGPDHQYLIFERMSTAGETFTYRTEKYVPPMILVATIPEPASLAVLCSAMPCLLIPCRRR